eukprot:6206598-Pleurochrysis_carterae.AAC.2
MLLQLPHFDMQQVPALRLRAEKSSRQNNRARKGRGGKDNGYKSRAGEREKVGSRGGRGQNWAKPLRAMTSRLLGT